MFTSGQTVRIINKYSLFLGAIGVVKGYAKFDADIVEVVLNFDSQVHYAMEDDLEEVKENA
jgi:hypothetical protein